MCDLEQLNPAECLKAGIFNVYVNRTVQAIRNCDQQTADTVAWQMYSNYPEDYPYYTEKVNERLEGR